MTQPMHILTSTDSLFLSTVSKLYLEISNCIPGVSPQPKLQLHLIWDTFAFKDYLHLLLAFLWKLPYQVNTSLMLEKVTLHQQVMKEDLRASNRINIAKLFLYLKQTTNCMSRITQIEWSLFKPSKRVLMVKLGFKNPGDSHRMLQRLVKMQPCQSTPSNLQWRW